MQNNEEIQYIKMLGSFKIPTGHNPENRWNFETDPYKCLFL